MKGRQANKKQNKRVYKVNYVPCENSKEALRRLNRELVGLVRKTPIKKEELN